MPVCQRQEQVRVHVNQRDDQGVIVELGFRKRNQYWKLLKKWFWTTLCYVICASILGFSMYGFYTAVSGQEDQNFEHVQLLHKKIEALTAEKHQLYEKIQQQNGSTPIGFGKGFPLPPIKIKLTKDTPKRNLCENLTSSSSPMSRGGANNEIAGNFADLRPSASFRVNETNNNLKGLSSNSQQNHSTTVGAINGDHFERSHRNNGANEDPHSQSPPLRNGAENGYNNNGTSEEIDSTKNTPTENLCEGKKNGHHPLGLCLNQFILCFNQHQILMHCPHNFIFAEENCHRKEELLCPLTIGSLEVGEVTERTPPTSTSSSGTESIAAAAQNLQMPALQQAYQYQSAAAETPNGGGAETTSTNNTELPENKVPCRKSGIDSRMVNSKSVSGNKGSTSSIAGIKRERAQRSSNTRK